MFKYEPKTLELRHLYKPRPKSATKSLWHARIIIYALVGFVALLGLIYQFVEISMMYFARNTSANLQIKLTKHVELPAITICGRLNYTVEAHTVLTPADILGQVPSPEALLIGCKLRIKSSFLNLEYNSSAECRRLFEIRKFTTQLYLCLRYKPLNATVMSYYLTRRTIASPSEYFEIVLDPKPFTTVSTLEIKLSRGWPPTGLTSSIFIYRDTKLTEKPVSTFSVTWSKYVNLLMPTPYDTNCLEYRDGLRVFTSREDCMQQCVTRKTIARLNRVPFQSTLDEQDQGDILTYQLTNENDLRNEVFSNITFALQDECQTACFHRDCEERLYVTQLLSHRHSPLIKIKVFAPQEPETTTEYEPKLPFIEYLIYLSSVIGLWLGWSVMHVAEGSYKLASVLIKRKAKSDNKRVPYSKKFIGYY